MVEICAIYSWTVDWFTTKIIHDTIPVSYLDASSDAAVEWGRMINADRALYECLSAEKWCNWSCEPNSKWCRVINVTKEWAVYLCDKAGKWCTWLCDPENVWCEKIN